MRVNKKRFLAALASVLLAVWTVLFATSRPVLAQDHAYYRLGVLPLQSPTKLAAMFMPLADVLRTALGRPVQFVTAPSFATYMRRVKRREYDIIYLNPLLYTQARPAGYHVIVKVAEEPFTGILVVRKDSPLHTLTQAALPSGLRLGFPDPNAYAATVMTRQYMEGLGIPVGKDFRIQYFGSQDSALMAVYSGLVDITGTWRPSLRSMPPAVRQDLRIIAETPPQPQMPIAVRDDLSSTRVAEISRALLSLPHSQAGRAALSALGFKSGFVRATDQEYMQVRP